MPWNDGWIYREIVPATAAGTDLDTWLATAHPHSSRAIWRERLERGEVRLGDEVALPGRRLTGGEQLAWHRPPWEEPEVPADFTVVHRDDRLLAVDKPSGLPTVPAGGFLQQTLLAFVRRHDPSAVPLHRLGRFTSGLVLFALERRTLRALSAAWRRGDVGRHYVALASGAPAGDAFTVDVPIGPVPYPPLGTLHAASAAGRPARTDVRVRRRGPTSFLADVSLATGRPHQVRIHLAAAGHPLVGDPLYAPGGGPRHEGRALPGDPGYRLRAVALDLPSRGELPGRLNVTDPESDPGWEIV